MLSSLSSPRGLSKGSISWIGSCRNFPVTGRRPGSLNESESWALAQRQNHDKLSLRPHVFSYGCVWRYVDLLTKALSFCRQCWPAGPHSAGHLGSRVAPPPTDPGGAEVRALLDTSCVFTSRGLPPLPSSFIFLTFLRGTRRDRVIFLTETCFTVAGHGLCRVAFWRREGEDGGSLL